MLYQKLYVDHSVIWRTCIFCSLKTCLVPLNKNSGKIYRFQKYEVNDHYANFKVFLKLKQGLKNYCLIWGIHLKKQHIMGRAIQIIQTALSSNAQFNTVVCELFPQSCWYLWGWNLRICMTALLCHWYPGL